jgi:E3 ubiquitin-protein ligase SIAH1
MMQCHEGHAVCAPCRDKLAPAKKCHVCGVTIIMYHRCRAMESLVESIRVPCPNASHGCDARPAYYDEADHRRVCPHTPLRCPGTGCGFVGSVKALRAHFTGAAHGWPPTVKITAGAFVPVTLLDGFNFILARPAAAANAKAKAAGQYLVLLNVARRPEAGGRDVGVTMHFVGLKQPTERLSCLLVYQRELYGEGRKRLGCHRLSTEINLECAEDLSGGGLPDPDGRVQFVVPDYILADEDKEGAIRVSVQISIKVMK